MLRFFLVVLFVVLSAVPGEAGPFRRRQVTRSTPTTCTGPNCYQPGYQPTGQLTINSKGGFEGQLPPSYFQQYAQQQTTQQVLPVAQGPVSPAAGPVIVQQRSSVPPAASPGPSDSEAIDRAATQFAQALAKKLGIEVEIAAEPDAQQSLGSLIDKLPTFRAEIVSPEGEVIDRAEIDFADYTRDQMGE